MSISSKCIEGGKVKAHVKMRHFPYPFKAALAICSDIDGCDRKIFVDIHRFLNDSSKGLGLPVSDSFFAVSCDPYQMSYFQKDGIGHSNDADFIKKGIQDGLIDSLHSWGDFNNSPPKPYLLRRVAKRLTREFRESGLEIKVWINHGSPNNRQNLKARLQSAYQGDDPKSPYHTRDELVNLGIRFYWWSEIISWPLSSRLSVQSPRMMTRLSVNALKNTIKRISGRRSKTRNTSQLMNLCEPVVLRDGTRLISFNRFNYGPQGPWGRPTRHTLRYSLAPRVLDELIDQEGYLILYTHLGMPRDRGKKLFPDPDKEALSRLADLYHNGTVWVAPTSRLLTFWLMSRYLVWRTKQERNKIVIDLLSVDDPITGHRTPEKDEISGLCFYTPKPKETIMRINGRNTSIKIYPPDNTGQSSIGVAPASDPSTDLLKL